MPQRAARQVHPVGGGDLLNGGDGSATGVDVSPEYTYRPRLVSNVKFTKKLPFTLTYYIRRAARGATVCPHGPGLPFHAPGSGRQERELLEGREMTSAASGLVGAVDAKTVGAYFAPAFRVGVTVLGTSYPPTRSRAKT